LVGTAKEIADWRLQIADFQPKSAFLHLFHIGTGVALYYRGVFARISKSGFFFIQRRALLVDNSLYTGVIMVLLADSSDKMNLILFKAYKIRL
jgi:hypothetical protein